MPCGLSGNFEFLWRHYECTFVAIDGKYDVSKKDEEGNPSKFRHYFEKFMKDPVKITLRSRALCYCIKPDMSNKFQEVI